METQTFTYKRQLTPLFFAGASRDDMKWTINYLIGLLEVPETKTKQGENTNMSIDEAKLILRQRKLKSHSVPADFNGMRDEVNPKYL